MVKNCIPLSEMSVPVDDITVQVIEKYDSFSDAMGNLVRVVKKRKLAEESENERKSNKRPRIQTPAVAIAIKEAISSKQVPGKGKSNVSKKKEMDIAKLKLFSSNLPTPPSPSVFSRNDRSKSSAPISEHNPKIKPKEVGNVVSHSATSQITMQITNQPQSSTAARQPSPNSESKMDTLKKGEENTQSNDSQKKDQKQKQKCPYITKYHKACPSQGKPITMESLAAALCAISCSILGSQYEHLSEVKTLLKMLDSKLSNSSEVANLLKLPDQLQLADVDFSVLEALPLRSQRNVKRMEEKLKEDPVFFKNLVSALSYKLVRKKHETNTARSVMGLILHDKLTKRFTWAGQSRNKGEAKLPFYVLKLKGVSLDTTMILQKKIVKDDDLSASINQWFSQRTAAYKGKAKDKESFKEDTFELASASEEEDDEVPELEDEANGEGSDDAHGIFDDDVGAD